MGRSLSPADGVVEPGPVGPTVELGITAVELGITGGILQLSESQHDVEQEVIVPLPALIVS